MITEDKVTEFFCIADDFYKFYDAQMEKVCLNGKKNVFLQRNIIK